MSLHWFLCKHPTLPSGPAAGATSSVGTTTPAARAPWLDLLQVFPLGAFVASKLEVALWDAFTESTKSSMPRPLNAASTVARSAGDGGGSSAADGEMALRSKAHLAEFWNRLLPPDRRKILGIEDDVVDPRQCRSFRGAGYGADHSVAGSSLTDGDHVDDAESANLFESDNESDQRDASGLPSFACGGSSVDVPGSIESADPGAFKHPSSSRSVRSDHYRREGVGRHHPPTRRHSGANSRGDHLSHHPLSSIGPMPVRLHRSGSGGRGGEEAGSALFPTGASSTAASTRSFVDGDSVDGNDYSVDDGASDCPDVWPWCAVRWSGRDLVASLFQSPLDRAGT